MTKTQIVFDLITWAGTVVNLWIIRRNMRKERRQREYFLKFRDAEVRALLTRLDEIARGEP